MGLRISAFVGLSFLSLGALASVSPIPHPELPTFVAARETHRVLIHNVKGGEIQGSRDGGKTWQTFGHVTKSVEGAMWLPTVTDQVFAYNFLRGPSNVFATATNAVHLRFSDPVGYQLPADINAPLVSPHGLSLVCGDWSDGTDTDPGLDHSIVTDVKGGTLLFGKEWTPKVGSTVLMGDGKTFAPIPYEYGPNSQILDRSYILIIVEEEDHPLEYLEFQNVLNGQVIMKREGEERRQVAKVTLPVEGIGRFSGGELLQKPGQIRANHAGVIDLGLSDVNTDPAKPALIPGADQNELRGGFQIVPSQHWQDDSMQMGKGVPMVFMIIGPIIDPPNLKRYDMGVDGRYPFFYEAFRGGAGSVYFQFKGSDPTWYEVSQAVSLGKFKTRDGTVLKHLRGFVKDALVEVSGVRVLTEKGEATSQSR